MAGPGDELHYLCSGNPRLDRRNLLAALNASLKRLWTDYLDLYQVHWLARHTNFFGHIGVSNEAPWGECAIWRSHDMRVCRGS